MHKLSREASILNLKLFLGYGFKIFAHLSQYSWSEYILFQINLISNFKSITNNIDMLKVVIVALLLTLALTFSITFGKQQANELPPKLFAGQIHYSRIPVQYWEHRIQMVKALGLNALSVYIMWNYHEIQKGKFDYQTQNKNLSLFLDLAQKYGMKVLFRPGPYVCAEWDFGGLPARLLGIKNLVIRTNTKLFLDEVRIYFESLVPIISKHLQTPTNPKGSIILLQIQNQYGFYGSDKSYIQALRKMWADLKIECEQYYVDVVYNLEKCHWNGANIGINNGVSQQQYNYARTFQKKGYLLGGQIYTGWLTHWGQQWQTKTTQKNLQQFGFLMANNHSYSMYMVHGGSNFGLTAGANAQRGKKYDFIGHVTSYDYDAPINQQGTPTSKYQALKTLIAKYATWSIPAQPAAIKAIDVPRFKLTPTASLLSHLGESALKNQKTPYMFETQELKMYNQGFVVYETTVQKRKSIFDGVIHDYALVYLDNTLIATLDRSQSTKSSFTADCQQASCNLKIVVQAMGHINFDHQMQVDYKGIIDLSDDIKTNFTWNIYKLPVDNKILTWNVYNQTTTVSATLLKASFTVGQVGDTFLDTTELNKGYLWVNGRNLGRYWKKGPQNRLFCPGVWLKLGQNTVHVLQLNFDGKEKGITGKKTLITQVNEDIVQN